jgi:peptidoglycan hydrolase-like protein with peptidoglycan-binding domain
MADRGSVTDNHYDHVHVWFYPGVYRAPATSSTVTYLPYPGHQHADTLPDDWHVGRIQKRLKALGIYTGELDSSFGPKTKSAVITFQGRNGLEKDGFVGPATWSKLKIPA